MLTKLMVAKLILSTVHLSLRLDMEEKPVNLCTIVASLTLCIAVTNLKSGTIVILSMDKSDLS
jgi:hypothetical protein